MVRLGVICPSEIAYRRFMPALSSIPEYSFAGIGVNSFKERFPMEEKDADEAQRNVIRMERQKAEEFIRLYGGHMFNSYEEVVTSELIDAVYIPLPPALHYFWAWKALENGKHVLVEKPAVLHKEDAVSLTALAGLNGLALHENYMFVFHSQLEAINEYIRSRKLGEIRLIRIAFGFPMRASGDFRYNRELGGGALIDCGGYTIKYASMLLGDSARIVQAVKNGLQGFEVDMYGSGVMVNDSGMTAHVAFGMDNDYRCELEVWGSKGTLYTNRVLTAPAGFIPQMQIRFNGKEETLELPADDAFRKSLLHFLECMNDETVREKTYGAIGRQAGYIDEFNRLSETKLTGQENWI